MNDINSLTNANVAQNRQQQNARRQRVAVVDRSMTDVVRLETVAHVAHTLPIAVRMSDDDNFVAELNETLRELKDVHLDAAHVRIEEIRTHRNTITFSTSTTIRQCRRRCARFRIEL